jgi:hypothetical protein
MESELCNYRPNPRTLEAIMKLGTLPDANVKRDAVHVAVIPVLAMRELQPGEHLTLGIVDPYLTAPVKAGQLYYLCLYPDTTTNITHHWEHPAFPKEKV